MSAHVPWYWSPAPSQCPRDWQPRCHPHWTRTPGQCTWRNTSGCCISWEQCPTHASANDGTGNDERDNSQRRDSMEHNITLRIGFSKARKKNGIRVCLQYLNYYTHLPHWMHFILCNWSGLSSPAIQVYNNMPLHEFLPDWMRSPLSFCGLIQPTLPDGFRCHQLYSDLKEYSLESSAIDKD